MPWKYMQTSIDQIEFLMLVTRFTWGCSHLSNNPWLTGLLTSSLWGSMDPSRFFRGLELLLTSCNYLLNSEFIQFSMFLALRSNWGKMFFQFLSYQLWMIWVFSILNQWLFWTAGSSIYTQGSLLSFWFSGKGVLQKIPLGNPCILFKGSSPTLWARCFKEGVF